MENIDINSIGDIEPFYIQEINTYDFGGMSVNFNCDVKINSSINALYIDGNEIICNNMAAEYDINVKRIVADNIDCESLEAFECTCDNLKGILNIDVDYLDCPLIVNCGNITSKTINTVDIECFECTCEKIKYVNKNIIHLNILNNDD